MLLYRPLIASLAVLLGCAICRVSIAGDLKVEAEARKLQGDAMDVDFLSLDLKNAQKKLEDATKKCGGGKCSDALMATIQRDLGIVLINAKNTKGGQKAFEAAFAADASVTIGKDYLSNAEVAKAWNAAKGSATTAPTATATATATATTTAKPPTGANAEGNLEVKVKEAPIGYPLPVTVDMPEGLVADVVKLFYKTAAMEKYKTVEAKKYASKYIVTIGCEDTPSVGEIKYYVRAYDAEQNEVEHYGTLKKPGVLTLVEKLPDDVEAPSYPGGKEPEKCVAASVTVKGVSLPGEPRLPNDHKRLWFGVDFQQDALLVAAAEDICGQQSWACSKDGTDVGVARDKGGIPTQSPAGGRTRGGPAVSTTRVLITLDYFIVANISLALRAGYAFLGGNPTSNAKFTPFHLEGRVHYFFSSAKDQGARFYALFSAGWAQFDAVVPNIVAVPTFIENTDNPSACAAVSDDERSAHPACRLSGIKAYRLAGQGFVAPGFGLWYMISAKLAINAAAKLLLPLPTFSPGAAVELGLRF